MTRWMVPRAAVLAAAVLVCACLATAWLVPLFDPDEGYYPATAAESVDGGRSWDLQFNGEPRWDKPVLSYALIQSAFSLFGRNAGAARVPSAIQGAALVLAVAALVTAFAGPGAGALSGVVLSTTVGIQVFSRVAHPEIALALSIGMTQLLLVAWLLGPGPVKAGYYVLLIGVSMGYGLLAKGPVAVAVPAIGVLLCAPFVLDRERWGRAIRDGLAAVAVSLAIAAPWYIAMTLRHGREFLQDSLWQQNVARYTGQLAVHASDSPLFYVLPAIAALLPWTALLVPALGRIRRPVDGDLRARFRFCIAMMALATFAFYSLSASKLASYILALAPSTSVLIGLYLDEERALGGHPWAFRATSAILLLTAAGLLVIAFAGGRIISTRELTGGVPGGDADTMLLAAALAPAAVLAVGGVLVLVLRAGPRIVALAAVGAMVPLVTVLAARPLVGDAYPWQQFAARIAQDPASVWVENYRAPSLTFYAGRRVARITNDDDLLGVINGAEGWLIVPRERTTRGPLAARIAAQRAAVAATAGSVVLVRLE